MNRLFTNLIVLGLLGAATAASAQDENRRDQNVRPDRPAGQRPDGQRPGGQRPMMDRRTVVTTTTRRTDFGNFHRNVQATRRFRAGSYRAPPGFAYRRWGYGQTLPGIYFRRDYWITNFVGYGLFAPPEGLVWVRYGPDAMLINQLSGQIIQVRYGVFY